MHVLHKTLVHGFYYLLKAVRVTPYSVVFCLCILDEKYQLDYERFGVCRGRSGNPHIILVLLEKFHVTGCPSFHCIFEETGLTFRLRGHAIVQAVSQWHDAGETPSGMNLLRELVDPEGKSWPQPAEG
jgi:hypothetical protein